jgi:hypothetical protein
MKLRFLALVAAIQIFICVGSAAGTEGVKAKTDQRIELMSIVFRLAGSGEYSGNQYKAYVNEIEHVVCAIQEPSGGGNGQTIAPDPRGEL